MPSRAVSTALTAALLLVLFDITWVLVVEREQPTGYFALTALLVLGPAMLVGLVFDRASASPIAVGACLAGLGVWLIWGAVLGLVTWAVLPLLLRWAADSKPNPFLVGTAVAAGLGCSAIIAPRVLLRAQRLADLDGTTQSALLTGLTIALVAGIVMVGSRVSGGHHARALAVACAGALLLSGLILPGLGGAARRPTDILPRAARPGSPIKPHVLLIVLDTVRADHLTLYGYARETTPRFTEFLDARPGTEIFPSFYANSSWTVPSHASLFTGLPPSEHGAHFTPGNQFNFGIGDHRTLAEAMQDVGYYTIGVFANPWLEVVSGMRRGFEVYGQPWVATRLPRFGEAARRQLVPGWYPGVYDALTGDLVLGKIEEELGACGSDPCFAFANLLDAHSHYVADTCRGEFANWGPLTRVRLLSIQDPPERNAELMDRYDEEICEIDRMLTGTLERLAAAGILDDTWVFITSDHGEAFGEHGSVEHGTSVYNEQVWIPLIVMPPVGRSIVAERHPASLVDLAATVAAIGGAEPLGVGRDLRVPADGQTSAAIEFYGDPTKIETRNPRAGDPARSVVLGNLKLVDQSGRLELFDIEADPQETTDLASARPADLDRLRALLPDLARSDEPGSGTQELSPEVVEQLKQLGYGQ